MESDDLYKDLKHYEKQLLVAAAAGPLRIAAGSVRIIRNVGPNSVLLATNNSNRPLFVRISAANFGYPVGGHFYFSIYNLGVSKDAYQTHGYFICDIDNFPAAIQSPAVLWADFILNPNEQLWGKCFDQVRDVKITSVTVG